MTEGASFTNNEAKQIGSDVNWTSATFDVEQFRMGLDVTVTSRR